MWWDEASVKFLVILGSAVFYVVHNYSSHYARKDFPDLAGHALGIFLKSHFNLMCSIILQGSSLFFPWTPICKPAVRIGIFPHFHNSASNRIYMIL